MISPVDGAYVADDDGIVNVTVVAEAAQGLQEVVVLVNDNPVDPDTDLRPRRNRDPNTSDAGNSAAH